ncbi:MAG: hypothetical protein HYY24_14860 [Verrucomicrobia bacterium]|nr:hypothetical protein [Verrucomicrobiota bacterium]
MERIGQITTSGESRCVRLRDELAKLQPDIIRPGGDKERTPTVRAKIALFLAIAALAVVTDYLLLKMLIGEIKPELARDFWGLLPLAIPVLLVMAGLKAFPLLRFRDEPRRMEFERGFAALLPWLALPLLGGLAWRLAQWTADPVQNLLADGNATRDFAVTVAAFLLQLGAQTIVGTAALCAAERLAYETRPSSSEANKAHADLKSRLDADAKLLDENRDSLAWARAKLATTEADLQVFLDQAVAALEREKADQEAEERTINLLRRRAGSTRSILPVNQN